MTFPRCTSRLVHRAGAPAWGWGVLVSLLAFAPTLAAAPSLPQSPRGPQAGPAEPVRLTAMAAVLVDARSGQVLYGWNPHLEWPPASTTKIMTALVALERARLDTPIEISPAAAQFRKGTVVGLPPAVKIPLRDLLYALMLSSGNDAALAIAEGVAGSVPAFVDLMNRRAIQLGATHTHFTSPHGLYDRDHVSTAHDLALITRVAMQHPAFREIVNTRGWVFSVPGRHPRRLINHNRLLSRYPGADGVKTGYVHQSGQTLVASATRNEWRLIAVLLHTRDPWGDASRLLTYGFTHYRSAVLALAGEPVTVEDVGGDGELLTGVVPETVYAAVAPGEVVHRRVLLDARVTLPVHRHARIGRVNFYASGQLLRSVPLVAAGDVRPSTGLEGIISWVRRAVERFSPSSPLL